MSRRMPDALEQDVVAPGIRNCLDTNEYPYLALATCDRLKVYLDVNHWVALAKARLGRPASQQDQQVYEMLRNATAAGRVIVPLTAATYMEVARIGQLRQRTDLANVVAEISGLVSITSLSKALDHQLRTALAARFDGPQPAPLRPFGLGQPFALGDTRCMVLKKTGGGAPDLSPELIREMETGGRVFSEYLLLPGPEPHEIPALRALGYRPEEVAKVEKERLEREKDLAVRLDAGTSERDRLGDLVHARYLYWELGDRLSGALEPYGISLTDFFANGKEWLTDLLDDIPSAAVQITLSEKGFRNSYKKWTGNDIRDGDAMAAAIPYCDVAMSDNYVAAQLAKSQVATRQGTLVLSRLGDLRDRLPDLIAAHQR
ncbi:MAG TPA: hypothetical protein VFN75_03050 [Pseudonocardiaceae bacterium]|nr:hypothetical protein [Pseudonocardiaceae bacterium]